MGTALDKQFRFNGTDHTFFIPQMRYISIKESFLKRNLKNVSFAFNEQFRFNGLDNAF